ncbi:hypothetical protein F4778DRAFT_503639 [Xylariomycetidae sp. FL2044]|nr:hypothetical protein F4778DRAFT_503639 [Xylariomycetidae sp. FL2044]
MLSRSNSTASTSLRSPRRPGSSSSRGGSIIASISSPVGSRFPPPAKTPTYICRHASTSSRLNATFADLRLPSSSPGTTTMTTITRKCPDCQTATPEGLFAFLGHVRAIFSSSSPHHSAPHSSIHDMMMIINPSQAIITGSRRRFAEALFDKLAAGRRRRSRPGPLNKEQESWDMALHEFAVICYHAFCSRNNNNNNNNNDEAELGSVCATIKSKYGAGVDRQVLRALARAACVEEGVGEVLPGCGDIDIERAMGASLKCWVDTLRDRCAAVESFAQVRGLFASARDLGRLADETFCVLTRVGGRLEGGWK